MKIKLMKEISMLRVVGHGYNIKYSGIYIIMALLD